MKRPKFKFRANFMSEVLIPLLLVSVLSIAGGWGVMYYGSDFRYLLLMALAVVMMVIISLEKRALLFGFVAWIWMFILGYRTIPLTPYFSLHPLIIFLGLLYVLLLVISKEEGKLNIKLPALLWMFSVTWIWGFIPGTANGFHFSKMFSDALNFAMIFPIFMITIYLSRQPGFWKTAALNFLGAGALITFLGSLEFYLPQFRNLLPGLVESNSEGLVSTSGGFMRASFAFFGATPAVIISALALPMVWMLTQYYPARKTVFVALALIVILSIGIYISGTRAAWLMVFVASIMLAYFGMKWVGLGLIAVFWAIISRFLAADAMGLVNSMIAPFSSGQILDSSLQKRVSLQQNAFQLAFQNPSGVGWAGSGWVHSDFVQIIANLGFLAGALFLLWYFHTLYRAIQLYREDSKDRLLQALITSFVLCGIVLATEGIHVLTQFIVPVWFAWGFLEAYLQYKNPSKFVPE